MCLHPPADQSPRLIERARRVFITRPIQHSQIGGELKQEAQFLDPQVCLPKMLRAFPRIGGLYQRFENVDGDGLDAVPMVNLWLLGNFSIVGTSHTRNW